MTRSEIDSLRQDSKAAMKLASALVAKNIEQINFERTFNVSPIRQGGACLVRNVQTMQGMTSVIKTVAAKVLKDSDLNHKDKLKHPKVG